MKSLYHTLSSAVLTVAIFAIAAPAAAQGRRPSGHGADRPRQSMQQQAPSSNRSTAAPQARPSSPSTAAPQARPSNPSNHSTATPQSRPSSNRPSYSSPGGNDNRPHGGGNHGGGRNNGGDNKGYQNQRPNANPGRPVNNDNYNNNRNYRPTEQNNRGDQRPVTVTPGNGNDRPGGGNARPGGNDRPGSGNARPGGNDRPGSGNGNNYRPGDNNSNHRPGGHGGSNGNNYRPGDNNGNHRPGGGYGDNHRPGGGHGDGHRPGGGYNRPPAGGPHHGGINHGGPRPDYNRYRWHSDVRPRGPRDRWYDYYRYNRWSWRAPIAPPHRQWRPRLVWYYRPVIPTGYRYYVSAPIISGVLGLEFGTYIDASLNYLYYNGYDIDGYQDNVVYLRDVNMMGYSWPDVMLQYDSNGGMYYAEFVTSTSYQDDYRFRSLYNSLCTTFGTPINSGNGHFSWYGRNGSGFVNLNTMYDGGRFFTVLTFGV